MVGMQPFGGLGLSGTGPKAGGPQYLLRMSAERCTTINTSAIGGNASLLIGKTTILLSSLLICVTGAVKKTEGLFTGGNSAAHSSRVFY